jgi:hypothetical protein
MRIVECGAIGDSFRVEDDQIGGVARGDDAAIGEAERHRCPPVILNTACGKPSSPRSRA